MPRVTFEQMMDPEKYGLVECPHCHGYGSSLKDPEGVNTCTRCGGSGLVKKPEDTGRYGHVREGKVIEPDDVGPSRYEREQMTDDPGGK